MWFVCKPCAAVVINKVPPRLNKRKGGSWKFCPVRVVVKLGLKQREIKLSNFLYVHANCLILALDCSAVKRIWTASQHWLTTRSRSRSLTPSLTNGGCSFSLEVVSIYTAICFILQSPDFFFPSKLCTAMEAHCWVFNLSSQLLKTEWNKAQFKAHLRLNWFKIGWDHELIKHHQRATESLQVEET